VHGSKQMEWGDVMRKEAGAGKDQSRSSQNGDEVKHDTGRFVSRPPIEREPSRGEKAERVS